MKNIIKNVIFGIGWGFSILVMVMLVGVIINPMFVSSITQGEFIIDVCCSAVVGIAFVLPSLVYNNSRLSRPLQVIIHLGIGFAVYIPCAFFAGWIPTMYGVIATCISLGISLAISLLIYLGFYFYYKSEAKKMNAKIKAKLQ